MSSKKKSGVSNSMPKGQARPLGTPTLSKSQTKRLAATVKNIIEKPVDTPPPSDVISSPTANGLALTPNPTRESHMDLTLTRNDSKRRSTQIVYTAAGLRGSVRISKSAFKDNTPPATVVVSSDVFAEAKTPRAKMTAEERKAARLAAPKLTLAEKIAKREKQLDAMRAKAASEAAQPSL